MKIFMTGGTGFVGSYLGAGLAQMGHEIVVVTRSAQKARKDVKGFSFVEGDPKKPGSWQDAVAQSDVIVNLAGTSVFTPWTKAARQSIRDSRVLTTRNVVDALSGTPKARLLLSASAVGYYGAHLDDEILDEASPPGKDFLAEVGKEWEGEAGRAEDFGVRVVICRFGIVFGRNGGALSKMVPAFKNFVGSAIGSGKQWFPWIHQEDLFRIMVFLMEKEHISGPVNCMSPNPVRNKELTKALAQTLHRPVLMPAAPAFLVRTFMGDFGEVILKGQRAIPRRLLDEGFEFRFPSVQEALRDLLD